MTPDPPLIALHNCRTELRAALADARCSRSSESMVPMSRMRGAWVGAPAPALHRRRGLGPRRSTVRESRNASPVTERFARRHGWLTAFAAAQVGGRNVDHHLRL